MRLVDRDLDRILAVLRKRIRERGFTQLEVQETIGWGRSYISQLLTRQKSLRVEHVLMILKVIGVEPGEFFAETYQFGDFAPSPRPARHGRRATVSSPLPHGNDVESDLRRIRLLCDGIVQVLTQKNLITAAALEAAIARAEKQENRDRNPWYPG